MDLVKSHLMFAVREEVEVLKERIEQLVERITHLETENQILRAGASQVSTRSQSPFGIANILAAIFKQCLLTNRKRSPSWPASTRAASQSPLMRRWGTWRTTTPRRPTGRSLRIRRPPSRSTTRRLPHSVRRCRAGRRRGRSARAAHVSAACISSCCDSLGKVSTVSAR